MPLKKFSEIVLAGVNAVPTDTIMGVNAAGQDVRWTPAELGAATALVVGTTPISGGTNTRVLYQNGSVLGEYTNTQLTSLINPVTATLSGAIPAFPNNTTTFFRGDGTYAGLPGSFAGFANPTASVGLTAVNGSATTAIRSDAAPPLDQTAAYAFSGLGATNLLTGSALSWNNDLFQRRVGAGNIAWGLADAAAPVQQIAQVQSVVGGTSNTAGQPWRFYGSQSTGTGLGGGFEWWSSPAGSTGSTQNALIKNFEIVQVTNDAELKFYSSAGRLIFRVANVPTTFGGIFLNNNNAQLLVNSLSMFSINTGLQILNGGFNVGSGTASVGVPSYAINANTFLTSTIAATLQLGAAAAASPVAQTLQAQGSRAGTDSNVGGANLTVKSGQGTGIGTGSDLIFQTPALAASGTGAQTMTTALTLKGATQRTVAATTIGTGGYTVATLPAGVLGDRTYVTDALAPAFLTVVVGGGTVKTPVYYDGTNWIGG